MRIAASRMQMREMDRITIEEIGIPGAVLMENAGAAVAEEALRMRGPDPLPVVVVAGPGNNGGDGFVVARRLHNRGIPAVVFFLGRAADSDRRSDAGANLAAVVKMGLRVVDLSDRDFMDRLSAALTSCSVAVDAMLGTGSSGRPREPVASAISILNRSGRKVLAVDIPSGLDCDTGKTEGEAVRASVTVTFGVEKAGFALADGPALCGKIVVADISIPPSVIEAVLGK